MSGLPLGPGGEFDLIREILASGEDRARGGVVVGAGDDAAVLDVGPLAVSCDLSVEDVHFRRSWLDPREIGYRAVAAALSDLAAMAAQPLGVLVALGIADADAEALAGELARGVREALNPWDAVLLGGDLTRSPGPMIIDVTALGRAPAPVRRSGARPGDRIWVTGRLGASAAAVRLWESGRVPPSGVRSAYARPIPRIREALWLQERVEIRALIDLSDGLVGDAGHLAAAEGVGIVLEASAVPADPGLEGLAWDAEEVLRLALSGGEDYELCIVAGDGEMEEVADEFRSHFGLDLTPVGHVTEGTEVLVRLQAGTEPEPYPWRGWDHLAGGPTR